MRGAFPIPVTLFITDSNGHQVLGWDCDKIYNRASRCDMSMKTTGKLIFWALVACLAAAPLFAQKLEPMTVEQTLQRNLGTPGHPGSTIPLRLCFK